MKTCPTCHTVDLGRNAFCYKDGARLVELAVCSCGAELLPIDRFCRHCGLDVEAAPVPVGP